MSKLNQFLVLSFYVLFFAFYGLNAFYANDKLSKENAILKGEIKSLNYQLKQCKFMYSKC